VNLLRALFFYKHAVSGTVTITHDMEERYLQHFVYNDRLHIRRIFLFMSLGCRFPSFLERWSDYSEASASIVRYVNINI